MNTTRNPTYFFDRNSLRIQFSEWMKNLYPNGFRYYATFHSDPVVSRRHLEGLIQEWSKRINKKLLGRNWWRPANETRRIQGIVFFERNPFCHAHAIIKPPMTSWQISEEKTIELLQNQWSLAFAPRYGSSWQDLKKEGTFKQKISELRSCITEKGNCLVKYINTEEGAKRACKYSLKQARFQAFIERDDYKFLSDLESYVPNFSMNRFSRKNFDALDLYKHLVGAK